MFWSLALWLVSPAPDPAPAVEASAEVRAEQDAPSPTAEAARLIEEATRAYRVRDFGTTIARLDRAYQLTGATELLYELGDAHARYYELDRNPDHLRQARSFFRAFARRSEAAGASPRDAWERVSALSKRISLADAGRPREADTPTCPRCPPTPTCPAPAPADAAEVDAQAEAEAARRAQRRADASVGLIAGGVSLAVPGIVLSAVFLAEGRSITRQLEDVRELTEQPGCGGDCDALWSSVVRAHERGRLANGAAATGLSLAVLGGAMAITGATIAARDRRGKRRVDVRVTPSVGGLSVSGRF